MVFMVFIYYGLLNKQTNNGKNCAGQCTKTLDPTLPTMQLDSNAKSHICQALCSL